MRLFLTAGLLFFCSISSAYQSVEMFNKDQVPTKLLVFLSQKCPCSQSHVDHLNKMAKENKNIHFYGVITDPWDEDSKEALEKYFVESRFQFPIIKDPKQQLIKKYEALKTPHITILKKSGTSYQSIYDGGVSNHRFFQYASKRFLEENLKDLRNNKKLTFRNGPSLGCYIRRI